MRSAGRASLARAEVGRAEQKLKRSVKAEALAALNLTRVTGLATL